MAKVNSSEFVSLKDMVQRTGLSAVRIEAWLEGMGRTPIGFHGKTSLYVRSTLDLLDFVRQRPCDENVLAP